MLVTCNPDVFSNPTLVAFFEAMAARGRDVALIAPRQQFAKPEHLGRVRLLPGPGSHDHLPTGLHAFLRAARAFVQTLGAFAVALWRFRSRPPSVVIAVDPPGLRLAQRLARMGGLPRCTGFFSFEIFFRDELTNRRQLRHKAQEIGASQPLEFCLVQDRQRQALLCEENKPGADCRFFRIPVAPSRRGAPRAGDSGRARSDKVVFSGTLAAWGGVHDVLDAMEKDWNPAFAVEFHSRFQMAEGDAVKRRIRTLRQAGTPVSIHDCPFVDQDDYHGYLAGFGIGLCFYLPQRSGSLYEGKNIEHIGLASGKFATYMMLGIPTVTTRGPVFAQLNERYGFGQVIDGIAELPLALARIRARHDAHRQGCLELYRRELGPDEALRELSDFIDRRLARPAAHG